MGGIIGDEMGLGKTAQLVGFLGSLARADRLQAPALIVVPATVIGHWVAEFHKWYPPMRVLVLHGSGQ